MRVARRSTVLRIAQGIIATLLFRIETYNCQVQDSFAKKAVLEFMAGSHGSHENLPEGSNVAPNSPAMGHRSASKRMSPLFGAIVWMISGGREVFL
jgi:hypothetical protein